MSSSNRTNIPNSLNEHWMPFTDNKSFKKNPRLITDAKGVYLTNHEGKKMIDASSGLFAIRFDMEEKKLLKQFLNNSIN